MNEQERAAKMEADRAAAIYETERMATLTGDQWITLWYTERGKSYRYTNPFGVMRAWHIEQTPINEPFEIVHTAGERKIPTEGDKD